MRDVDIALFLAAGVLSPAPSGGGSVAQKDVNFYGYDGSIVASYSAADFANLAQLPANPSHTGLTSQGWNWTLADAKTCVAAYGKLDVGQMYTTADGKTRLYITIPPNAPAYTRTLGLKFSITSGSVTVDYGDGSTAVTVTDANVSLSHDYTDTGDYVITLTVNSGIVQFNDKIFNDSDANANRRSWLKRLEIGSSLASIGNSVFTNCYGLQSVTIPNTVTSIGNGVFSNCYGLRSVIIPNTVTSIGISMFTNCFGLQSVTIPNTVTSIGNSVFSGCYGLQSVTIPSNVTSIGNNEFNNCRSLTSVMIHGGVTSIGSSAFYNCYSLPSVTIPSSVTSIGANAFESCYGLGSIHFKPTTPPTVDNSNAWGNLQTSCKIYVPAGKLSDYTGATNYPSSSTYTYVEE